VSLDTVIKNYELYNVNGVINKTFEQDSILWLRVTDIDDPLIGVSPLKSLKYPITNTKYAYDYLNSISGKKGAIGILSDNNKSPMGGMPLKSEEKAKIENQYTDEYGVGEGQRKVIVTQSALQWQPMTYPTRDLLLLEQIDAYFLTIVDHFGMNVNLFSSKNQTYENVKNSIIQVYQDTIIPEADLFCQELTKFLNIKEGQRIVPSYDHVEILKDNSVVDSISQLVQSNILTPLQAQNILAENYSVTIDNTGNSILDRLNGLSPIVANNMLANLTPNEVRKLVGLPSVDGGDTIPTPSTGF
jgi:phage portal protein BeeE